MLWKPPSSGRIIETLLAAIKKLKELFSRQKGDHEPLWKCFLRATPLLAVVSVATSFLHQWGPFNFLESTALDTLLNVNPLKIDHVYIVGITNRDYREIFGGKSPLDPGELQKLIDASASGNPQVIAIDVDTGEEQFASLKAPAAPLQTVWAQPALPLGEDLEFGGGQEKHEGEAEEVFLPGAYLGGRRKPDDSARSGVDLLIADSDGIVRHYLRELPVRIATAEGTRDIICPSLPVAIADAYKTKRDDAHDHSKGEGHSQADKNHSGKHAGGHHETLLRFAGGRQYIPRISAKDVLELKDTEGWKNMVAGKAVIIGGYYDSARDRHVTPVGQMPGVELTAQAAESEIQGGTSTVDHGIMTCVEILCGLFLVFLNWRFPHGWVPLVGLISIPVIALATSFIAFKSLALWVNFVPVLLAAEMHTKLDRMQEEREMHVELEELRELKAESKKEDDRSGA